MFGSGVVRQRWYTVAGTAAEAVGWRVSLNGCRDAVAECGSPDRFQQMRAEAELFIRGASPYCPKEVNMIRRVALELRIGLDPVAQLLTIHAGHHHVDQRN